MKQYAYQNRYPVGLIRATDYIGWVKKENETKMSQQIYENYLPAFIHYLYHPLKNPYLNTGRQAYLYWQNSHKSKTLLP